MSIGSNRYGARGEELACRHYLAAGYEVVARNWRCRDGEVDLVVRRGDTLVFVEVKARTSLAFGHPAEAVHHAKQRRLRGLATRFCAETETRAPVIRFDVAAVLRGAVDVVEDAF